MRTLDYDILVAGGGTAGSAAAIAAARRGARVLLVEQQNCLGGTSTAGCVGQWFASLEGMGDIFDYTTREMARYGARFERDDLFNPEYLKLVWQRLADETGVDILFHASVSGAACEDGTVSAARVVCCSQELEVRAKYFVDASGEGDLAALAGAAFEQGDPESGLTLHMTLAAWMYDTGKPVALYLPEGVEPIWSAEELPGLGAGWLVDERRIYMNATKVMRHDPTDPFSLSEAEREARRQLARVAHYLQRTRFPTFALGGSGSRIGIREGRRITGDYVLRKEDVLDRATPLAFEDGVAVATSEIDFHSLTKPGSSGWRQRLEPYSIPLRCLVAKGFNNLLMAGKCISADQVVHSSCRMTPTCCAMGQAVGTAAAMAVAAGAGDVREVPIAALRAALTADGMELDPRKHNAFAPLDTRMEEE